MAMAMAFAHWILLFLYATLKAKENASMLDFHNGFVSTQS